MDKHPLRAALVLAFLFACGGTPGSPGTSTTANGATVIPWFIGATNVQTSVKAGTTVQWHATDGMTHTVTSSAAPAAFTELQVPGNGFSAPTAFNTPGTFAYFCSIHGANVQNGTLTVTP